MPKPASRTECFDEACAGRALLVQINVVSEGVDLPALRRLIDARPTLSPVYWLQLFGRITRPGEVAPHYVATNRNLIRHAYTLHGVLPPEYVSKSLEAFGGPGKRAAMRTFGLEGLGKLAATQLPLHGGGVATMWSFGETRSVSAVQYAVILHHSSPVPLYARRENAVSIAAAGQRRVETWGKWRRIDALPADLCGFASSKPSPLTPKMRAWWGRSAAHFGLDAAADVNARQFAALPVLCELKCAICA